MKSLKKFLKKVKKFLKDENHNEAIKYINELIYKSDIDEETKVYLLCVFGKLLSNQGNYGEACKVYKDLNKMAGNIAGKDIPEIFVEIGINLGLQEKYEEAIKAYDRALELDINCACAFYNKGIMLIKYLEEIYEDIVTIYNTIIYLSQGYDDGDEIRSLSEVNLGMFINNVSSEQIKNEFIRHILVIPCHEDNEWFSKGNDYYNRRKYREAIDCYTKGIETSSTDCLYAMFNKAVILDLYAQELFQIKTMSFEKIQYLKCKNKDEANIKGLLIYQLAGIGENMNIQDYEIAFKTVGRLTMKNNELIPG